MRALFWVVVGSLAGFILAIFAYSFEPLPSAWTSSSWENPGLWLSIAILGGGLVCFVIFLISGLISVLNWGADRPGDRP